jgi:phosphoglucosamine mutase
VSTVMSNMGLDRYLQSLGLTLARTRVGDRYVGEHMRAHGLNFGGEPSGHIILSDVSTTGDGLLAGLHVLSVLAESGQKMSTLARVFEPAPQELVNIRYSGANPMDSARVKAALAEAESLMGTQGRMVVRKSGTEPLIRVMAEALEAGLMKQALLLVVDAVKAEA